MSRKQFRTYCLLVFSAVTMLSCEYYLGINQQPKFTEQQVEEGLNIFGLLRPDYYGSYNRSFVYVQQVWPVLQMDSFGLIRNVDIWVERIVNDAIAETIEFPLVYSDSLFADTLYRPLDQFLPLAGERYRMVCRHEGFPDAIGETIFPPEPAIIENTLKIDGKSVSFTLAADSLIGMIDIYLVMSHSVQLLMRLAPDNKFDTEVELFPGIDPQGLQLILFAYDHNMAVYSANSNISLNFNKYRTTFSTLESGYGVFGSLNYTCIEL